MIGTPSKSKHRRKSYKGWAKTTTRTHPHSLLSTICFYSFNNSLISSTCRLSNTHLPNINQNVVPNILHLCPDYRRMGNPSRRCHRRHHLAAANLGLRAQAIDPRLPLPAASTSPFTDRRSRHGASNGTGRASYVSYDPRTIL